MFNGVINNLLWCLLVPIEVVHAPPPTRAPSTSISAFLIIITFPCRCIFFSTAQSERSGALLVEELRPRLVINGETSTPRRGMMDSDPVGEGF